MTFGHSGDHPICKPSRAKGTHQCGHLALLPCWRCYQQNASLVQASFCIFVSIAVLNLAMLRPVCLTCIGRAVFVCVTGQFRRVGSSSSVNRDGHPKVTQELCFQSTPPTVVAEWSLGGSFWGDTIFAWHAASGYDSLKHVRRRPPEA